MIYAKEYTMYPGGGPTIFDTDLKYATVLSVVREQKRYYSSGIDDPDETEYRKILGSSSLEFASEPEAPNDLMSENVRVIYKI